MNRSDGVRSEYLRWDMAMPTPPPKARLAPRSINNQNRYLGFMCESLERLLHFIYQMGKNWTSFWPLSPKGWLNKRPNSRL